MSKNTSQIIFVPTCSKCGEAIRSPIGIRRVIPPHPVSPKLIKTYEEVIPYRCPNCGVIFNQITMPAEDVFQGGNRMIAVSEVNGELNYETFLNVSDFDLLDYFSNMLNI